MTSKIFLYWKLHQEDNTDYKTSLIGLREYMAKIGSIYDYDHTFLLKLCLTYYTAGSL
jgi:hypothetical protein